MRIVPPDVYPLGFYRLTNTPVTSPQFNSPPRHVLVGLIPLVYFQLRLSPNSSQRVLNIQQAAEQFLTFSKKFLDSSVVK
jgi:hypothetical protein